MGYIVPIIHSVAPQTTNNINERVVRFTALVCFLGYAAFCLLLRSLLIFTILSVFVVAQTAVFRVLTTGT